MDWLKDSYLSPRNAAEKESQARWKDKYRITTVIWGHSNYKSTLHLDKNVRKNVYEMTLDEFITDWMEHFNQHPAEDIIEIVKL